MKSKLFIYIGILLLLGGILLRTFSDYTIIAIMIIVIGVACKMLYLVQRIKYGKYKPGIELLVLFVGLTLFFLGIYFKSNYGLIRPYLLIVPGILLKILFIILFIKKVTKKPADK